MPEGHSIRHFASLHHHAFAGTFIEASSPQGRFSEDAKQLNNRMMTDTSAYGKHLFLHFDELVVHIHLGLYGWFDLYKNKGQVPRDSIRLRIANDEYLSCLRGPTTCALIPFDDLAKTIAKLGPDPLRDDADPEKAWTKIAAICHNIPQPESIIENLKEELPPLPPGTEVRLDCVAGEGCKSAGETIVKK